MLTARVRRIAGRTVHSAGGNPVPPPAFVKIDVKPDGIFPLYFDAAGRGITDTWHQTLEEAKAQAKWEFEIDEADWFTDGD